MPMKVAEEESTESERLEPATGRLMCWTNEELGNDEGIMVVLEVSAAGLARGRRAAGVADGGREGEEDEGSHECEATGPSTATKRTRMDVLSMVE